MLGGGNMDLKESLFWHMQVSERTAEMISGIEQEKGQGYTLGALKIAAAKVEVLQAILDETDLADEYRRWRSERGGKR